MTTFTKKDLKTGMWVQYRDGIRRMVLIGSMYGDVLVGREGWHPLECYDETLKRTDGGRGINGRGSSDIMKIYSPNILPCITIEEEQVCKERNLIWERDERVTIEIAGERINISSESAKAIKEALVGILKGEKND